jgi:DNA-binding transcriptional LysR family regulator
MKLGERDLEYFAVVTQYANIGRAAEALGLSQPALSMSLRRLEKRAGAKIVRRTPKGVELTDVGQALLKRIDRLRLAHEDVLRELADIGGGRAGHLRVGTGLGVSNVRLANACSRLLMEAPNLTMEILGGDRATLLPPLRAGNLDFALTAHVKDASKDLVEEIVRYDEFVVYCSREHRLAKQRRVSVHDLAGQRWAISAPAGGVSEVLLRAFRNDGLPEITKTLVSADYEVRLRTIASTDLLGWSARAVVQEASKRLPLKELRVSGLPVARRTSAIIYRKDAYLSPAAVRLIDLIKTAANHA